MGKKERLQKELDLLLEKMRFWRYSIFAIISGVVGILYANSQEKLVISVAIYGFLITALLSIGIAVKRLSRIDKDYRMFLDQLEEAD